MGRTDLLSMDRAFCLASAIVSTLFHVCLQAR
jgi:hypothetical protein